MNSKRIALSRRYATALGRHLNPGLPGRLLPASRLGCQAVRLGLETLDLARIHEQALGTLKLNGRRNGLTRRAEQFFTEALAPIVETHRAARRSRSELLRLNKTLEQRTAELAVTNRQLQRGILRRKQVEAALKKNDAHYSRMLQESLQLQEGLRQLTHRVLAAQEEERQKISRELQSEIAQTLLGINVRLLSLKRQAWGNLKGFKNEIASARRLVAKSALSVRRVAQEFSNA